MEWLQLSSGLPAGTNPPERGSWLAYPLRPEHGASHLTAGCHGAPQQKLLGRQQRIPSPRPPQGPFILLTLAEIKVTVVMCVCLNFVSPVSCAAAPTPPQACLDPKPQPAGKSFPPLSGRPHAAPEGGRLPPRLAAFLETCLFIFSQRLFATENLFRFCFVHIGALL